MATINEAIKSAAFRLESAGVSEPRREAALLLEFSLERDTAFLIAHPDYELTHRETETFEKVVQRRECREPFHLITGTREFYGLEFEVVAGVLVPRPETELLVARAIEILNPTQQPHFFEVGVGSGCISVSILREVTSATATAVDLSDPALDLAAKNAAKHGVSDRLKLGKSDIFARVEGRFHLIVSNPPYVPRGDATRLQPEVKNYDPPEALFAGEDGLDLIRRIVAEAPDFLKPAGSLLLEIGYEQDRSVRKLLESNGWSGVKLFQDLQGIPRVVEARRAR